MNSLLQQKTFDALKFGPKQPRPEALRNKPHQLGSYSLELEAIALD